MKDLIESRIGYSKLIFLDRHGNHNIFNEHKGVWDDGVWYSNTSYKPYVAPVTTWKDTEYSYGNWRKPIATYKATVTPKNVGLKVGDMVELLEDVADTTTLKTYETGEICEVVAVNQDFSCDLMIDGFDGNAGFLYNVPYHALNYVEDFEDDSIDPVGTPAYHNYASPSLLKDNK
jgi:hypothetical protein